jgi:biopolymer transport protein ExbD
MTRLPVRRSALARFRAAPADTSPIATINTTPMIDMMLVLLILFIVAIPVRTHRLPLDLPQPGPGRPDLRPVHRLDLDAAGGARWDGVAVDEIALRRALVAHAPDPARPDLHLTADGETRYERVDQVLAAIRNAGVNRLGLVDNRLFSRAID